MTIKDIARESGYAVGTVSRVLNNNPRVSEDARRKILAVVAQHGYQPNANAKHLKQQVPEGLALIVKGTQNALFADLLDKLQPCLEARGYTPTVYYNNGSTDELACAQTIFAERRPCGLFFIGAHPQCFTPALASLGIPCLLLTNNAAGLGIENLSSVSVDDRAAAAVMIEQLYAKGHRVVGIIGDRPETSRPSQQRLDGCLDALQRLGVPFNFDRQYRLADFSMQGGLCSCRAPAGPLPRPYGDFRHVGPDGGGSHPGHTGPRPARTAGHCRGRVRRHCAGAVHRAAADDDPAEYHRPCRARRRHFAALHRGKRPRPPRDRAL